MRSVREGLIIRAYVWNDYSMNGCTIKEIIDYPGVHYATVSLAIKRREKRKKWHFKT